MTRVMRPGPAAGAAWKCSHTKKPPTCDLSELSGRLEDGGVLKDKLRAATGARPVAAQRHLGNGGLVHAPDELHPRCIASHAGARERRMWPWHGGRRLRAHGWEEWQERGEGCGRVRWG